MLAYFRRRSRSSRVELTSNIPVSQYDSEERTSSAVFSSRYRKAWDNLQVHSGVGDDGKKVSGNDTLASQPSLGTFQSTGPRKRDDVAVKTAGSEIMVSPSRAGTMKSVGGISEAYHGSEEILIDDDIQAAPQHLPYNRNAGNTPGEFSSSMNPLMASFCQRSKEGIRSAVWRRNSSLLQRLTMTGLCIKRFPQF